MNREEAAREIDNTACCFSDKRFRAAMHMAADALRREQEEKEMTPDASWINVNDRLPDNARWVLGATRDDVREMRYRRNWMQGYWDKPSIESPDPIYWREMPEPPKEENHEI